MARQLLAEHEPLIGLDERGVVELLGPPSITTNAESNRVLRYVLKPTVADFLYFSVYFDAAGLCTRVAIVEY